MSGASTRTQEMSATRAGGTPREDAPHTTRTPSTPLAVAAAPPVRILAARDLEKSFRRRRVVRGVSLELREREIVGLLGPNGAGKTTTFRMVVGLESPDAGRVSLDGRDVTKLPLHARARSGLGYLPQESTIFRGLSVRDNLHAVLEATNLSREARASRADSLLSDFGLAHLSRARAETLSGGERRRLEIARALATSPRFLLLDEPFTGLDPIAVAEVERLLRPLASERGVGLLITDHAARELLSICDRVYLMHDGAIACVGTPAEVAASPFAREVYLGEGFRLS
jgi:lipopolysaccharide export system ATP-binding protein